MLWELTAGHQVITITHLPQIAAFGDAHFQIAKQEVGSRVVSRVHEITGEERAEELAAMLDGTPVSEAARRNALEMIERAEQFKRAQRRVA
jgi:DNA repair protein RecN (Recombination protein N)